MDEEHHRWWRTLGLDGTAGFTALFEGAVEALQRSLTSISPPGSGGPLWMPPVKPQLPAGVSIHPVRLPAVRQIRFICSLVG